MADMKLSFQGDELSPEEAYTLYYEFLLVEGLEGLVVDEQADLFKKFLEKVWLKD